MPCKGQDYNCGKIKQISLLTLPRKAAASMYVGENLPEPLHVLRIHQAVSKHPVCLMQPQQGHLPGLGGGFGVSPHDPLNDPGDVPEVEGVVGLGWGGQQLLPDLVVHLNCAVHHCSCCCCHLQDRMHSDLLSLYHDRICQSHCEVGLLFLYKGKTQINDSCCCACNGMACQALSSALGKEPR